MEYERRSGDDRSNLNLPSGRKERARADEMEAQRARAPKPYLQLSKADLRNANAKQDLLQAPAEIPNEPLRSLELRNTDA
jgi:hypothetical protein